MVKGYGKGNSYGGGKTPHGLGQDSYGKKSAHGYNPASYKGTDRKGGKWLADPRA
jgi:hypothetical protein